jgi:hypothetical protein
MEQLQLFDPDDYRGLDGQWHISLELEDWELNLITSAASTLGMDLNEYINHKLREAVNGIQPTRTQ